MHDLCLNRIATHREMGILLLLLQRLLSPLLFRQCPPHGSCLLHPQILANVLGSSGGLSDAFLLLLVVYRQDARDRLAYLLDLGNFGGGTAGDLGDVEVGEGLTVLGKGFEEFFLGESSEFVCLDHFY